MGSPAKLSQCGQFVAAKNGQQFSIHSLLHPTDPGYITPIHYDLASIFARHRSFRDWPILKAPITVPIIEWEHIDSCISTKVAAYASDGELHLILVFVFDQDIPIVIEADSVGVDCLQWLPFASNRETAYSNSTLLAVVTKYGIDLRVYSLAHANMLFSVPKPLVNQIFSRPGDSGVFSVIATPYLDKNTSHLIARNDPASTLPTLLHFYTDGVSCSLLASLKLDFDPSSRAMFSWSRSGKWLLYFDVYHSLDTPKLMIFNSLGIHERPQKDISCHVAQPTRTFKLEPSKSLVADINPSCLWGKIGSVEYIVVTPTSTSTTLNLRVSDLSGMYKLHQHNLSLTSGQIWLQPHVSPTNQHYKLVSRLPHSRNLSWSKILSFGSSHLLAADDCVVIFRAILENILSFSIVSVLCVSSSLLEAKELDDGTHALAFSDHIVLVRPEGLKIIVSARVPISEVTFIEKQGSLSIWYTERGPKPSVWKQFEYSLDEGEGFATNAEAAVTAPSVIGDTTTLSNPVAALKNARSIFGDIRREHYSRLPSSKEEITDTFQAQKRRKA